TVAHWVWTELACPGLRHPIGVPGFEAQLLNSTRLEPLLSEVTVNFSNGN
ncbi:unnamed protein product, partial [Allacma fusca]